MAHEEQAGAVCIVLCFSLIGTGLLIGGALWLDSMPGGDCPCDPGHCCTLNEICPYHAPCLCENDGLESSEMNICAPRKGRDESDKAGAISMIVIGACLASTLAFTLVLLAMFLAAGLLVLIGKGVLKCFGAIGRVFGNSRPKPSTEMQTVPVQTPNV